MISGSNCYLQLKEVEFIAENELNEKFNGYGTFSMFGNITI